VSSPPRIWRTGEAVRVVHDGKDVIGFVKVVDFDDMLGGHVGSMPLLWHAGEFRSLFCGKPTELHDPGPPEMSHWVIYHGAKEHPPGAWVVRRWDIYRAALVPTLEVHECASLEEARDRVPPSQCLMARSPEDNPAIVEVWI
jgi:hypothetical protein